MLDLPNSSRLAYLRPHTQFHHQIIALPIAKYNGLRMIDLITYLNYVATVIVDPNY
jgi:hypothetical protein